ncbi:MAG: KamA family radical SAM protein [Dehalococcoidia bacterium]
MARPAQNGGRKGGCAPRGPRYLNQLEAVPELERKERRRLRRVSERYAFRSNDYYQSLIDWEDPADPIRRIVMPDPSELVSWGVLDASDEASFTVVPGLEHKYADTALLLVNHFCGGYCRFCFRKRLFMDGNDEVVRDLTEGLAYIRRRPGISNIVLSGGDPLILPTRKLERILTALGKIPNVRIIRIGTKMPAFNPYRVLDDPALLDSIRRHSRGERRIYIMAHFNHPRELSAAAIRCMSLLQRAGAITVNQTPILCGVNDDPAVLAQLFAVLTEIGVPPYYVFQCRPTEGNRPYVIPVEESYRIFESAQRRCCGLARWARMVMSHESGKIQVIGIQDDLTHFRFHRATKQEEEGRVMSFPSNPDAYWFDDYSMLGYEEVVLRPRRGPALRRQP